MNLLGLEIGGSKLQFVLGDGAGQIQHAARFAVDGRAGGEGIRRHIERVLPELLARGPIDAVGVGFGGPVDWRTGTVCRSHQIEGWSGFELGEWLRGLTGGPVFMDNDANVAALGEARCGAGSGFDPSFYVTLGSGVGGGLVAAGQIYHGATPGEGEIGHVRLDRQGTTVESRCSGWAVDARIRELVSREPHGALARMAGADVPGGEARHLHAAVEQADAAAVQLLREFGEDLAFGLSHVVHLFHPEVLILGGGLAGVGEPLRAAVAAALPGFLMRVFRPGPRVALSALREDAVPAGALLLAAAGVRGHSGTQVPAPPPGK